MSEPHNSIQPGSAEPSATTKGGSLLEIQIIACKYPPITVQSCLSKR